MVSLVLNHSVHGVGRSLFLCSAPVQIDESVTTSLGHTTRFTLLFYLNGSGQVAGGGSSGKQQHNNDKGAKSKSFYTGPEVSGGETAFYTGDSPQNAELLVRGARGCVGVLATACTCLRSVSFSQVAVPLIAFRSRFSDLHIHVNAPTRPHHNTTKAKVAPMCGSMLAHLHGDECLLHEGCEVRCVARCLCP